MAVAGFTGREEEEEEKGGKGKHGGKAGGGREADGEKIYKERSCWMLE